MIWHTFLTELVARSIRLVGCQRTTPEQIEKARSMGAVEVPLWRLPTTVTFRDINDPISIELVLPEAVARLLSSLRRASWE